MTSEAVFFQETPAQRRFVEAVFSGQYRFLAYGGAIRGGKTALAIILAQALCRIYPRSRWAIIRKDLPTLRRNVLPTFEKFRIPGFMGPVNQSSWIASATNGSEIVFFTESISEDPDLNRWRGLEVNGFFPDEANELQEASWRKMIERAGSWVVPHGEQPPPLIIPTFNPSAGWIKRVFYDPWAAGTLKAPYYFQMATIADNPHLPPEYVEGLKALPERDYKRFVQGDWSFISGAFFDELTAETHLVPSKRLPIQGMEWVKLPDWWTYWGSYDWGFRHPAVAMAFAKDGDGTTYLLDTVRMHRLGDEAQAEKICEALPAQCLRMVYAGKDAFNVRQAHASSVETVADVFGQYRIFLQSANTARRQGWSAVRRMLTLRQPDGTVGRPRLVICDTQGNRWAVEQLLEQTPDPTDAEDVLKVDANDDGEGGDDAADCLRYGLLIPGTQTAEPTADERYSTGRDPRVKEIGSRQWRGPESELAEEYSGGAGATLPVGYGL